MNFYQRCLRMAALLLACSSSNIGHVGALGPVGINGTNFSPNGQGPDVLPPAATTFDIPFLRFEGWDPNNNQDKARIARVKSGFKDAMTLAWYAGDGCFDRDATIFQRYFGNDKKSVPRYTAHTIFKNIHGLSSDDKTTGNEMLSRITIRKTVRAGDEKYNRCTLGADSALAFLRYMGFKGQPDTYSGYIVLCEGFWELPDFHYSDKICKDIGSTANDRMDTFGRGLLHEILHFPPVSMEIWHELIDVQVGSGNECYGSQMAQWLAKKHPEEAGRNSDNYAWFAEEYRWSSVCKREFKPIDTSQDSCQIV